jgi:TRAP-type mannitol/chloroaromatic compound transport system permease small subunit
VGEVGKVLALLRLSQVIDFVNARFGRIANWLVLLACLISAGNAMSRYAFDLSSNAWLEVQWYMFALLVMLGAPYTLQRNEHVRVDIIFLNLSLRGQLWIDILGAIFFLLPACIIFGWLSWPFFYQAYSVGEWSGNAGGLIRWPIKFVLPLGFALLALQGISELIKRVGALNGYVVVGARYERPTQ